MPITACDLLLDRVLSFHDKLGITVRAVLIDSDRALCGNPESHPYELLLTGEGNQAPNDQGSIAANQRLRRADQPNAAARRLLPGSASTKWYVGLYEIQRPGHLHGLPQLLAHPPGYRAAGRRPAKALFDLIAQGKLLPLISDTSEEVPLARLTYANPRHGWRRNSRLVQYRPSIGNSRLTTKTCLALPARVAQLYEQSEPV